ncbi:MAG: Hsp20/alpha crystallin family protein [Candidatus Hodarchaeales archaeon]
MRYSDDNDNGERNFEFIWDIFPFKIFGSSNPDFKLWLRNHPFMGGLMGQMQVGANQPRVNVKREKNQYVLEFEVPGISKEDLNIELNTDELWLEAKNEDFNKEYHYHRVFKRAIDPEKATAKLKSGILTLTLPYSKEFSRFKLDVE